MALTWSESEFGWTTQAGNFTLRVYKAKHWHGRVADSDLLGADGQRSQFDSKELAQEAVFQAARLRFASALRDLI